MKKRRLAFQGNAGKTFVKVSQDGSTADINKSNKHNPGYPDEQVPVPNDAYNYCIVGESPQGLEVSGKQTGLPDDSSKPSAPSLMELDEYLVPDDMIEADSNHLYDLYDVPDTGRMQALVDQRSSSLYDHISSEGSLPENQLHHQGSDHVVPDGNTASREETCDDFALYENRGYPRK